MAFDSVLPPCLCVAFSPAHLKRRGASPRLTAIATLAGFAGWDPAARFKIRVVCARPYHALFMHNMLIR